MTSGHPDCEHPPVGVQGEHSSWVTGTGGEVRQANKADRFAHLCDVTQRNQCFWFPPVGDQEPEMPILYFFIDSDWGGKKKKSSFLHKN